MYYFIKSYEDGSFDYIASTKKLELVEISKEFYIEALEQLNKQLEEKNNESQAL